MSERFFDFFLYRKFDFVLCDYYYPQFDYMFVMESGTIIAKGEEFNNLSKDFKSTRIFYKQP